MNVWGKAAHLAACALTEMPCEPEKYQKLMTLAVMLPLNF